VTRCLVHRQSPAGADNQLALMLTSISSGPNGNPTP
jgi:hypothetical protein